MLSYQTIEPHTLELLRRLSASPLLSDLRLVGGTSLALQYGHRRSIDLDLFGTLTASDIELHQLLSDIGRYEVLKETEHIKLFTIEGVRVDIVDYFEYPWIDGPILEDNLCLASPKDIAAMKVYAIEGRGSRKDFVDMYFLLKHYTLTEILDFYKLKYPNYSIFRALMSLTYFDDAEKEMMPKMIVPVSWEEVKSFIVNEVRGIK